MRRSTTNGPNGPNERGLAAQRQDFDSEGKPLDGSNNYVLHFQRDDLPPRGRSGPSRFMTPRAANPINRFAIGDRDPLKYNADGSLDIYIQPESPSEDKVSNWLPSSKGHPAISLKVYAPKLEALDSRWAPLAIKRAR